MAPADESLTFQSVDARCSTAQQRLLVKCLLLRAAHGGMAGDVNMLLRQAATWLHRFQSHMGAGEGTAAEPGQERPRAASAWYTLVQTAYAQKAGSGIPV